MTRAIAPALKPLGFRRRDRHGFVRLRDGVAQGVHFQPSGWGGRDFCVEVWANLVAAHEFVVLTPGFRLRRPDAGDLWLPSLTQVEADASIQIALAVLNEQALSWYETTGTLKGYIEELQSICRIQTSHHRELDLGFALVADGRDELAIEHLCRAILLYREDAREWTPAYVARAELMRDAITRGESGQLLSAMHAANAHAHGVADDAQRRMRKVISAPI